MSSYILRIILNHAVHYIVYDNTRNFEPLSIFEECLDSKTAYFEGCLYLNLRNPNVVYTDIEINKKMKAPLTVAYTSPTAQISLLYRDWTSHCTSTWS